MAVNDMSDLGNTEPRSSIKKQSQQKRGGRPTSNERGEASPPAVQADGPPIDGFDEIAVDLNHRASGNKKRSRSR